MTIPKILWLLSAAICCTVLTACDDSLEASFPRAEVIIDLDMTDIPDDAGSLHDAKFTFSNISNGTKSVYYADEAISLVPGLYDVAYSATCLLSNGVTATLRARQQSVTISQGRNNPTLRPYRNIESDDLIISEIFFAGTLQTSGNQYYGDDYVKLYNNTGGYGLTTRMPTVDYIFPQEQYNDIIQLNYYDVTNPAEHSLVSIMTYVEPAINHDLRPARNLKWELRLGWQWMGFRGSATYFEERLRSGFRYSTVYAPYAYTQYDPSGIDGPALSAPPQLSALPSTETTILDGYRVATNGTRIDKQGVEFQLTTPRWQTLRTSLTLTGAWFHSIYSNSQQLYSAVSDVYNGVSVADRYVGLYNYTDGRVNDQINTNFMFDTQIPRWGLIFTTTLQCMWRVRTTRLPIDGIPTAYLDASDGQLHPWTPDATSDPMLRYLIKTYNPESFNMVEIPFAGYLNLKATKTIGRYLRIAMFVNRLLDWLPSYRTNGLLIRRSANPYFGMELNVSI